MYFCKQIIDAKDSDDPNTVISTGFIGVGSVRYKKSENVDQDSFCDFLQIAVWFSLYIFVSNNNLQIVVINNIQSIHTKSINFA